MIEPPQIENIREITDPSELAIIAQQQQKAKEDAQANVQKPEPIEVQNGKPKEPAKEAGKKPEQPKPGEDEKTEEKPDDKPVAEKRTLRERLSPFRDKTEDKKSEDSPEQLKSRLQELEEKAKLLEDPAIQAVLEAKKSGVDLYDLVKKEAGTDYSKLSDSEIYKLSLDKSVFKSEKDKDFDEQVHQSIEAEMERFDNQTSFLKRQQASLIREELESHDRQNHGKLFNFKTEPDPQIIKTYEQFGNDLKNYAQRLDGQIHYGVRVTQDMIRAVIKDIVNPQDPKTEDGRIDATKKFDDAFWVRYRDLILNEVIEDTKYEVIHKEADETEAKPGSAVHTRPPDIPEKPKQGSEEYAKLVSESLKPI